MQVLSIVLITVTNANYTFVFIDVGSLKNAVTTLFQELTIYKRILADTLDLPEDRPILNIIPPPIPLVFLADATFSLSNKVMGPYVGKQLEESKGIFNYRHCKDLLGALSAY